MRGIKWFIILIWISLLLENLTTLYVLTLNLFFYEISNFNFCSLYIMLTLCLSSNLQIFCMEKDITQF